MGEIRILIPDELHTDILELGRQNNRRLPDEVTALLVDAVARAKNRRPSMAIKESGKDHFYPNGELVQ